MNLFQALEKHTEFNDTKPVNVETINSWLKDAVSHGYNAPTVGRGITTCQAAVIIAYAGNPDNILTDSEYTQFHVILGKMQSGINSRLKVEPITAKVIGAILKAGSGAYL